MTTLILPNAELVALAWLATVPGITSDMVGTTLPEDETKWSAKGFIQATVVAGSPNIDLPISRPVVQLDFWAVNLGSGKPPWGKAQTLGQTVWQATYLPVPAISLANIFSSVRLMQTSLISEVRRGPTNKASYARFTADLQMTWVNNP